MNNLTQWDKIPVEIIDAARKVVAFFMDKDYREYSILGLVSISKVERLERELDQAREAMLRAYDACARAMHEGPDPDHSRCPLCILGRALAAEGIET